MKVIKGLSNYKNDQKSIVTIGTFDGVHIGHLQILEQLIKKEYTSIVLTFFPHPRKILQDSTDLKLLNTLSEKIKLLEKTGVDVLIVEPFTKDFSKLTALDFSKKILVEKLAISKLIVGHDHRFGKNREGDFEQLQEYGKMFGFIVEEISAKDINNSTVSSTKIRKALSVGNILLANKYLGYAYMLSGKVVHGKGLGKKWNYPTINIFIEERYKLIPKTGVYIVKTTIKNIIYFGIMNIGYRPTLDGKTQTIEVHLLDFNANLYGESIQVLLLERLRDEQKFESLEQLFKQIKKDEKTARKIISAKYV